MAYSTPQINQILAKADRTMYKIGVVAYQNMFSELDEALDYNRDIIYIYKKAVEWGDDYFVGTEKLDKIVERLSGMIAVWDYGMLTPIYNDVAGNQISVLPPCYFLVDLCDVNVTNVQDGQYLTYDTETGKWINTGPGSAIRLSQTITATAGQTVFVTSTPFILGLFDLYLNGVRLNSSSYSTFGSYSITLNDACSAGDILDIVSYDNNSSISSLLALTTNGSTGVATLSGTVLNIPNYGLESISSAAVTGTSTKTLTLTKLGGGTVTASWTDLGAGSGTTNYVAKWSTSTTLTNSLIYDNGTSVLINKTSDNSYGKLQVDGGAYFTGNMYIETSANPTQFMLRGTNPEFWFDAAYGGGTARMFINRAGTGNQSTLMFTTGANVVKGSAWDFTGNPWTMGITNNTGVDDFKFAYGDIYTPASWVFSITTSRVLTFTSTPYVGLNYIYHQGNLTLSTLGGVPSTRTLTINGTSYDLSANRSWSVGTITSISTTGPITGGTITSTGTIGITQSSSTTDGYLSSIDWNTFSNKQNAITLTTTGNSGAATLIGSTLNIPQYQSVLTNPVTGTGTTNEISYWTSSSAIGSLSTVTYPSLTELSYVKGVTSSIQTQINAKFTLPSLTSGSILFSDGTTIAQDNSNLFWNDTSNRLGIGTSAPANSLDVVRGTSGAMSRGAYESASFSYNQDMKLGIYYAGASGSGGASLMFGATNFTAGGTYPGFEIQFIPSSTLASNYIRFNYTGRNASGIVTTATIDILSLFQDGNVSIGSNSNLGYKLDVTGTARISSSITANSFIKSGGTASQILAADGTVITAGENITISGGTISSATSATETLGLTFLLMGA